jgi:hypothetical protein
MRLVDVDDDADLIEYCFSRGWTDGLPVVPPTIEKVTAAIAASGRDRDEVVCRYVERQREVTVAHVATCAVMAGCRPEHVPVVLAIVEGMAADGVGLHALNATTGGVAVGFVVNGPIRHDLQMNWRGNVLGPGNRANSTIGRAVRLTQINAFGSVPGAGNEAFVGQDGMPILDRSTLGQPGKYAGYHVVENEDDHPGLRPLHVELGFDATQSVVTVFSTGGHHLFSVHAAPTAEAIVVSLATDLVATGRFLQHWCLIVLPPESAELFERDGWSKADVRRAIFEKTTRPVAWIEERGGRLGGWDGAPSLGPDERTGVAVTRSADDILLVIAGGPAGAFVVTMFPYVGGFASREILVPASATSTSQS